MDNVVKAATPEQIQSFEAKKFAEQHPATQILPAGFPSEKSIVLQVPVSFQGKTYTEINLRRLKGRDFSRLQKLQDDEDLGLLSIISDAPAEVLNELDADDFVTVSEAARDFLPRALRQAADIISGNGQSSQP